MSNFLGWFFHVLGVKIFFKIFSKIFLKNILATTLKSYIKWFLFLFIFIYFLKKFEKVEKTVFLGLDFSYTVLCPLYSGLTHV